ncbi:hypothetical protein BDK51DRAFT_11804, partial [Blyttiomyces helicus]
EEEDYLSDAFLLKATEPPVAPQPRTYSQRRKHILDTQKERSYVKPLKEKEREVREQGLKTHLPEDNIGFKMLQKMGFKKGAALGSSTNPAPATAPIPIVIREKRLGLGLAEHSEETSKRQRDAEEERRIEGELESQRADFREQMNRRFEEKRARGEVRKMRLVCETMDVARGIERHPFWLPERKPGAEEEEEDEEIEVTEDLAEDDFEAQEPAEQLKLVNAYLRNKLLYCFYCGSVYESERALLEICPGDTRDDHE